MPHSFGGVQPVLFVPFRSVMFRFVSFLLLLLLLRGGTKHTLPCFSFAPSLVHKRFWKVAGARFLAERCPPSRWMIHLTVLQGPCTGVHALNH